MLPLHPLPAEARVLILAPSGKDAPLTSAVLHEAGMVGTVCRSMGELCEKAHEGAGAIMLAEEALLYDDSELLASFLEGQPAWSDIPVLLLASHGADSPAVARAMETLGNVSLLERPTRVALLLSMVRTALRARARQYQIRTNLAERELTAETLRRQADLLDQSHGALRDADRRKDEFLATLAHELRNPLAPIRNALSLIRMKKPIGERDLDRTCSLMERQVHQLVRLVDDLLDVSRITRGKIELRRERVDLAAVMSSAVDTARPFIEAAGHRLCTAMPPGQVYLDADPIRLAQALSNLLNNAAKYTPRGGEISFTAAQHGSDVLIRVVDTGIGLPPELVPRVFDLFVQGDRSMERSQGGLGVGLALVRQFVEMHGGSVSAHSEGLDRGSMFTVRLPIAARVENASGYADPALAIGHAPVRKRRILIVDDNADAADTLRELLRALGNDVRTAYDGLQAIEAAAEFRPEVVLLDIGLPKLNGYELARRLRQQRPGRDMVLVALTGWGQDEDRRRSREAGYDHHLVKPVDLDALRDVLTVPALGTTQ